MSRQQTTIGHTEAQRLGWTRVDPKPWGKLQARWQHRNGWTLGHCGHPTALWPWMLRDPSGAGVYTGALREGQLDACGETITGRTHGAAWPSLREAMEYVESVEGVTMREATP